MMASAKKKDDKSHLTQKLFKNGKSREFRDGSNDLWLGMERRKFSYTIYIPERRSNQNRNKPESTILTSKHNSKG
jgi:hypothetical protein